MNVISFLFRGSYKNVIFTALLSVLAAAIYIQAIKRFKELLSLSVDNAIDSFLIMSTFFIGAAILSVFANHQVSKHFEFKISKERVKFSSLVLQADFSRIEAKQQRIIPILYNDTITLGVFAKTLPEFIVSLCTVISIWVYMFTISWQFTLGFIGIFGLTSLIILFSQSFLYYEERKAVKERNFLYDRLNGLVNGIKELTLNLKHKSIYAKELVGSISEQYAQTSINRNRILITVNKSSEAFILIALGLMVVLSQRYSGTDSSTFTEFFVLVTFSLPAVIRVGMFFSNLKKAEVAYEQLSTLTDVLGEDRVRKISDSNQLAPQEKEGNIIEIKDAVYQYSSSAGDNFSVGPFNLNVVRNEVLLINGGNGSGKTTFMKLLTGLYSPKSGKIIYSGNEVTAATLPYYRDQFSAVFVDSFVFDDLRYIDQKNINELSDGFLSLLEIQSKVEMQEGVKLSTTNLSFGQRSRLNLYRALLEDKDIYVFDEWAANQDPYFKDKFYREILPSLKERGKTVILISHDDKYYDVADRIVRMRYGKIESVTQNH